jgi:hypothetical protein
MVDIGTWQQLDEQARQEFHKLSQQFRESLRSNRVDDGSDLAGDWSVQQVEGVWAISDGTQILEGVTSQHRNVIEALYADGVQNLNR